MHRSDSCHILTEDDRLRHCDYLHTTADDPRPELLEALLGHIGETGHLVAYNSSYEQRILRHLDTLAMVEIHQALSTL
jgi:hypothetical protein